MDLPQKDTISQKRSLLVNVLNLLAPISRHIHGKANRLRLSCLTRQSGPRFEPLGKSLATPCFSA